MKKNKQPKAEGAVKKKRPGKGGTTVTLLLNESVRHLGKVGDVVEVKAGYARNYLLPYNLAVEPTTGNLKRIEEKRKELERIEAQRRAEQEAVLKKLEGVEITLIRKANERGHLFGSITARDIAFALNEQGYEQIGPDDINLHGKIDRIDIFSSEVRFDDDLKTDIKVIVSPDAESKAAMDEYAAERRRIEREQAEREAAAQAEQA